MPAITVLVADAEPEQALSALTSFALEEFGQAPSRVRSVAVHQDERGVSLGLIALILTIPSALINTMALAERMRLRSKIEKLIALAKGLKGKGTIVYVERADQVHELATMSVDQVIEAANDLSQKT